jgi:dihydroorotase-like cyclic amidohydrolase
VSKSKNCPYHGWQLQGKVKYTIVGGEIRYADTQ